MGTNADWLPIAERCADRFFCLMPDLPGHGNNTNFPITQPLNFEFVVTGLNLLLEQLDLDRVSLTGYSMGGRLALYAAIKFPKKITALILESANPGLVEEQARQERAEVDDKRAETLLKIGIESFVDHWYQLGLFSSLKKHPPLFDEIKSRRKQNEARWLAKIISQLSPGRQPPLWDKLGLLPMPVLLVAGALDQKYAKLMARMGANIPKAKVEIIPDAGHNTHLEQPKRFAELLTTFLT
jgi:2-succinyl-6-hydroxy-2,4-cyclohexadiene-1-carboxylate synthase